MLRRLGPGQVPGRHPVRPDLEEAKGGDPTDLHEAGQQRDEGRLPLRNGAGPEREERGRPSGPGERDRGAEHVLRHDPIRLRW